MPEILDNVISYAAGLRTRVSQLETALATVDGNISALKKSNRVYYVVRKTMNGKTTSKYLCREDVRSIRPYAHAKLAKTLLPKLKADLKASEAFIKLHTIEEEDDVTSVLGLDLLSYCSDIYVPKTVIAEEWMRSFDSHELQIGPDIKVDTLRGDHVRSKSEAIIANALYSFKLPYLYEKALYIGSRGHSIYPDFTILRLKDMKEIYWEHFGLMENPGYLRSALKKISDYIRNGILSGRDLICTFESSEHPLSSLDVDQLIKGILL